jgi:hypothetical protein
MDPLVKLDDDLQAVESAAASWEESEDKKTVTFTLRDDLKWTNGDPVTAEDYEWSWKRTISPELAADYAPELAIAGSAVGAAPADVEEMARLHDGGPASALVLAGAVGLATAYPDAPFEEILTEEGKRAVEEISTMCVDEMSTRFAFTRLEDLTTVDDPKSLPEWQDVFSDILLGTAAPANPAMIYHSPADELVLFTQGVRLHQDWCDAGADVLFNPLPPGEHIIAAITGAPMAVEFLGARFSGQDLPAVRERLARTPGVTWHDWVDPADLPALVAAHDVCLGIFGDTPKGLRVVPNKVYQGLAAGCVVVTSDTPPQRRLLGGGAWRRTLPDCDPIGNIAARRDTLESLRGSDAGAAGLDSAYGLMARVRSLGLSTRAVPEAVTVRRGLLGLRTYLREHRHLGLLAASMDRTHAGGSSRFRSAKPRRNGQVARRGDGSVQVVAFGLQSLGWLVGTLRPGCNAWRDPSLRVES